MTTFYTVTGNPISLSRATSQLIRNEFVLIQSAFAAVELAKGNIAGQTWTGTHTFPATTYGTTAAPGSSGTALATLDFAINLAYSTVLPGLTGNEYKFLTTTDGITASFSGLLKTSVIRLADATDMTKLIDFDLSALTTATTRTVKFGDRNVDLGFGYLKVSERQNSGIDAGDSVAADITQTRNLNTTETNSIVGATLVGGAVGLLAGRYRYYARAPYFNGDGASKVFLYNVTDGTYTGIGSNGNGIAGAATGMIDSIVFGEFTITSPKTFTLRHFTADAVIDGLGLAASTGQAEVYAEAEFWQIG